MGLVIDRRGHVQAVFATAGQESAMAEFKVGDIVQLKSGGPKMTCTKIHDHPLKQSQVERTWFAGGKKQVGDFPPDALMFPESPLHELVEEIEPEERRRV